jgi:WD40 repeat protein
VARLWDAHTGRLVHSLDLEDDVNITVFSPDSQHLMTASGIGQPGSIRVWHVGTGQALIEPLKHASWIQSALFTPEGQQILSATYDGTIRLWDLTNASPALVFATGASLNQAYLSPDGQSLLTVGSTDPPCLWRAKTGERVAILEGSGSNWAEFSPDSQRLITAGIGRPDQIWDTTTGQLLFRLPHKGEAICPHFSPDGKRVVTSPARTSVQFWDAQSGQPVGEELPHPDPISWMALSSDGRSLATGAAGAAEGIIRIWDLQTGRLACEPLNHGDRAQFSADGQRLFTTGTQARLWNLRTARLAAAPVLAGGLDNGLFFGQLSGDGRRFVTANWVERCARVWDLSTGLPITPRLEHEGFVVSAQFSPDGQWIVTAALDKTARVWEAVTGRLLRRLKHEADLRFAQFSPDGQRILTVTGGSPPDGRVEIWDAQSGLPLATLQADHVICAQFSPDDRRIVTVADKGRASLWDSRTGALLIPLPLTSATASGFALPGPPCCVHRWFSPDGQRVIVANSAESARVFDVQSGEPVSAPLKHSAPLWSAEFSPDGHCIVTASADRTARVWDARTSRPLTAPLRHAGAVLSAQFSPDGQRIVTGSDDNTARLWDAQTGQPVSEPLHHYAPVSAALFDPTGERILFFCSSHSGPAQIWPVPVAPVPVPLWVPEFAELIAEQRFNGDGVLEPNPKFGFQEIKQRIAQSSTNDVWSRLATWMFTDPAARPKAAF